MFNFLLKTFKFTFFHYDLQYLNFYVNLNYANFASQTSLTFHQALSFFGKHPKGYQEYEVVYRWEYGAYFVQ